MPTLAELCKDYGINPDGGELEKTASIEADTEASQISNELNQDDNSMNENGGDNMGLTDVYKEIFGEEQVNNETDQNVDIEKVAEAEAQAIEEERNEMVKVAQEWDAAGRFMAHGFFDELEKIAKAVEQQSDSEVIPQQLHAEGANKTQINDDSKLAVNTAEARNANANALKEKKVNTIMGKGKTVNVSGAVGQDNKVAPDAAK